MEKTTRGGEAKWAGFAYFIWQGFVEFPPNAGNFLAFTFFRQFTMAAWKKKNIAVSTLKGRVIEIFINASQSFWIRWKNINLIKEMFYNALIIDHL